MAASLSLEVREYFNKPLRQAARLNLDKADAESACETLRRAGLNENRAVFAKAALRRWRGEPVFEYHELDAKFVEYGLWDLGDADFDRLVRAQDRARENGDMRLVERIDELLSTCGDPYGIGPLGPFSEFAPDNRVGPVPPPVGLLFELLGTVGVDHFWNLLKEDGEIGEALREMQDAIGKPMFRSMVQRLYEEIEDDRGLVPFDPQPDRSRRKKVKRKKPNPENSALDEGGPNQWDLFE